MRETKNLRINWARLWHCHFLIAFKNCPWEEQLKGGGQDSVGQQGTFLVRKVQLCLSWLEDVNIEDSRLFQGAFLDY